MREREREGNGHAVIGSERTAAGYRWRWGRRMCNLYSHHCVGIEPTGHW
ncbi:unnamed protein product [Spirodela intermedia]|uniref:Uncharacterized protein n=1 Tax=Spirodela intermedia TaxID=51605 RepID=A0ABN7EDG5_SPIIN|nr:unnamed protein product [Spirodela intermedia]CAA6675743.1 unnamed protein product [Spirodela intermedia]